VSSETGNAAIIDSEGNLYVPDEVIVAAGPSEPIGDNLEIWIDSSATGPVFDAYSRSEADAVFVNVVGDTMNGPLYLHGDPTGPLEAATKDYVDTHSGGGGTGGLDEATANGLYVNIIGDTMTGPLFLPADPTGPLEAPTKQYVDARIWYGSQAEYDAIITKDPSVLYCIGV